VWPGGAVNWGRGGALAAAVGVAFDDELVAGGGEPVDGGLGQQRVGHQGEPFAGVAVGGDDDSAVRLIMTEAGLMSADAQARSYP
jgi:hypothetical protein